MTLTTQKPGAGTPGQQNPLGEEMLTQIVSQVDGELRVSSLTIADRTGTQHKNVLEMVRARRAEFESFGQVAFETRPGYNNSTVSVAQLNEPQSTLLMTFMRNSDVVVAFKLELVKQFYAMKQELTRPALPGSYADALRELAATVEQNAALEAKAREDAPKVLFADAVAASGQTILVGDLAKVLSQNGLDIGANRLFERLRDEGYLIKRRGTDWNRPTQKSMDLGLFKVKETAVAHSDGHVTVNLTPKVTGKGQAYFIDRFIGARAELAVAV